jgi:hypothetical protein
MKEMKSTGMNAKSCISTCISTCKKGFYQTISSNPDGVVKITSSKNVVLEGRLD